MNELEQKLIEQQAERIDRVNAIRHEARKISCPTCKATPTQPCMTDSGSYRISNHRTRNDKAVKLGILNRVQARGRGYATLTIPLNKES